MDWLVVMRRFDQETLFDRLAERGALGAAELIPLADAIAAFHGIAPVSKAGGGADGIRAVIDSDGATFAECPPGILDPASIAQLQARRLGRLERIAPALDGRRDGGFVRRCHGDLHLRNIFLDDGRPTLFDAIEFSETMATIDVYYDIAFLLMDLLHRGMAGAANLVFNRYLERTHDYGGLAALPLFLATRAAVRCHVSALTAAGATAASTRSSLPRPATISAWRRG